MILVVDDDADVREMLCEILTAEGYPAIGAKNGAEALAALQSDAGPKVSLVLLDLMMPVMSGFEFCERQRSDPALAAIPVALMSARWEARETFAELPFIQKPMRLDEVMGVVRRYCPPPSLATA